MYSRVSHYVNEIPFNIIVGLPFSPLLLPFIVTTCPDIWRSLTLNSRYASPVKKKGNAEESEACVDRASTFLKEDLPKKAISPLEKKIIWISKVGKKTLLIKVIHNPSLPKIIEPVSIQTLLDPDPHPLSRNYIVFQRYPRTTTTTPLSRERRLVQACYQRLWRLEHPQPRASSPSYNLLVNFASLLEGYVRWDKKYLERERERLDYSSSGRAYQAPSSPYARVTDILCRCAQPASQTVRTWSLAAASAATAQRERETPLAV